MRAVLVTVILAAFGACGESDAEFLDCEGKCDSVGPLSVSAKWVPVGGFVRAVVADGGDLVVEPAGSATIDERSDNRYLVEFSEAGFYAVKASGVELLVRVSDTGPSLSLQGAGNFVILGDFERVQLEGEMSDPLGTTLVGSINGETVSLDSQGQYRDVVRPAVFGVNFIEIEARDLAGNVFRNAPSFIAAPSYSLDEKTAAVGIGARALAEIASELSDELPELLDIPVTSEPVFSSVGQDVILERFSFPGQGANPGSIDLGIESRDGRLIVTAHFDGESRVEGVIDGIVSSSDFVARMQDLRVFAELSFANGANGITVTTSSATVTTTSSTVEVVSLIPDFIFQWLAGSLDDHVAGVVKERFGPWLTEVFASAEGDFEVPAPDHNLGLDYRLAALEPLAGQLRARIMGVIEGASPALRGPGAPTQRTQVPTVAAGSDLGMVLTYDLINQYLYRLWERDSFRWSWDETDLADALARVPEIGRLDPIIEINAEAALPPVASLGAVGSELSLGELRVEVFIQTSLFQATLKGTIGGRAEVRLPVVGAALAPAVELREVHANVEARAFDGLNVEALERLLVEIAPQAFASISGDLEALPLPTFDLSRLALDGHRLGLANATSSAAEVGVAIVGEMQIVQ